MIMRGFAMFYRLLTMQSRAAAEHSLLNLVPRVTAETRDLLVTRWGRCDTRSGER
jgi:hypothetical protein